MPWLAVNRNAGVSSPPNSLARRSRVASAGGIEPMDHSGWSERANSASGAANRVELNRVALSSGFATAKNDARRASAILPVSAATTLCA